MICYLARIKSLEPVFPILKLGQKVIEDRKHLLVVIEAFKRGYNISSDDFKYWDAIKYTKKGVFCVVVNDHEALHAAHICRSDAECTGELTLINGKKGLADHMPHLYEACMKLKPCCTFDLVFNENKAISVV